MKTLLACFIGLVLFAGANRLAYRGYFSGDDLDNLGWPTLVGNDVFVGGVLTPIFSRLNFRPIGHLYYRCLGRTFQLHYAPYVIALQIFHVGNVILLFFLLCRLGFSQLAAAAGALFYAFHAAVLEAYWKPMYVFDVLCAMFCLLCLLLYLRGHWLLALIPFWLAYKSKEIAVMLPVALLVYELLLAGRGWNRLIPYCAISLSFGIQALWHNRSAGLVGPYVLHFTPAVLWNSLEFYFSAILFLPLAGFAILALPAFVRDRRLYFGLVLMAAALVPLLPLPERLASVYWYIPLIGLAVAVAAVASRSPAWAIALFFVIWFPLNYVVAGAKRRELVALGTESRSFIAGLRDYARGVPPLKAVVYHDMPEQMHDWGVEAAIHRLFGWKVDAVSIYNRRAREVMTELPVAVISYHPSTRLVRGMLRTRDQLQSYIRFADEIPSSQLGTGWYYDGESPRPWIAPKAEATLFRPNDSREFEVVASIPPASLQQDGPARVTLIEDGRPLGTRVMADPSLQPLRWQLAGPVSGNRTIAIVSEPPRHGPGDPRDLGVAVAAFGYVTP